MNFLIEEKLGNIAILKFNRPDKGNSLNSGLVNELYLSIQKCKEQRDLKALILTGNGERFFCTGADLDELKNPAADTRIFLKSFSKLIQLIEGLTVLTASFINGDCIGGGLGLALSTDYLLASDHIRCGTPEITRGLFPFVISKIIKEKVGVHIANSLCFGARLWTAQESKIHGIVPEVVSKDSFYSRCSELIDLWNRADSELLIAGKACLNGQQMDPDSHTELINRAILKMRGGA